MQGGSKAGIVRAVVCALVGVVALLAFADGATAKFRTGLSSDEFLSTSDATRTHWFDQAVDARAKVVRIDVKWSAIEVQIARDPTNPADRAYRWGALDAAVRDAAARGLTPLFTVYFAPAWREAPNRPPGVDPGTWMPNPDAYGAFAKALATRYSGTYGGLPAVRAYEAWNESNLAIFLSPQYHDGGQFSIAWYRALLNAFYDNVKSVSGQNKVLVGGMAPYGDPPGAFRTRPLTFLRRLFCLKDNLKRAKCPTKAKFDILAFHAITLGGGPDKHAHNANDAAAGDLPRVREILRAAEKRHSIAPNRKRRELWVTEMWWESNPPDAEAPWSVSLSKQAKYIEEAIMQLHDQGAKVVINFPLVDTTDIAGNLQSGLFFADGSPKPSFTAFRFPLVAKRVRGGAKVSGKSPSAGKLKIQKSRGGGKWKTVKRLKVRENEVFSTKVRNQGTKGFRGVISGQKSLVWR